MELVRPVRSPQRVKELETVGTCQALRAMHDARVEMVSDCKRLGTPLGESLYLTVDLMNEVHGELLHDVTSAAGLLRESGQNVKPAGFDFFYTPGVYVESELTGRLDLFNVLVKEVLVDPCEDLEGPQTVDLVVKVVKLATWLLFSVMHTHPYLDGSGRMGRLLANSLFTCLAPVPVYIAPMSGTSRSWRGLYLEAIVQCRTAMPPNEFLPKPRVLAAIVLDSLWAAWSRVWMYLGAWHIPATPADKVFIGDLVITTKDVCVEGTLLAKLSILPHNLRPGGRVLPSDLGVLQSALSPSVTHSTSALRPQRLEVNLEDGALVRVLLLPSFVSMASVQVRVGGRSKRPGLSSAPTSPH